MKLVHVQFLNAPREKVYAALLDPETLKACVEGCESLTPAGPDGFDAVLRFGLLKMRGRVDVLDRVPPESLTLRIEGKGLPGSVRSSARIRLTEKDGGTELAGEGDVVVGGLLAAAGAGLVDDTARRLLTDFYAKLAARLSPQ